MSTMPASISYATTTPDTEAQVLCAKCTGQTTHKVLASVNVDGQDGHDRHQFFWSERYQTIQCLGCKTISFRKQWEDSESYDRGYNGELVADVSEALYPPRLAGLRGLGMERHMLPSIVIEIYDETLTALSNSQPVLAGIGLRALLEAVCKEKKAAGSNLNDKIDALVTQAVLTPSGATLLHKIRSLGNAAAHEATPHTDSQLSLAMSVVEHLLQDVYILPEKMKAEFN
jgi:hypothetical protein